MTFYEVVAQVLELLQREGRVSCRALKRQFTLDDGYLERDQGVVARYRGCEAGSHLHGCSRDSSPSCLWAWAPIGIMLFLIGMASSAWADGFRNPFQGAAANAQGTAFIAQADDPSAIYYNPAALSQLEGIQQAVGVQFLSPHTTFTSPVGTRIDNRIEGGAVGLPPPGQLFVTANLGALGSQPLHHLTVGIGLLNLFGFANEYPEDGPFATVVTKSQLPLLDIKPTIAYRIHERLSVGFGVDIFTFAGFVGEGQFEQHSIAAGNIPGTSAGDRLELNGTGTTAGVNASVLVTPWRTDAGQPRLNVGFIWRSQAILPLDGELLANGTKVADASTHLRLPETFEGGLAYWPLRSAEYAWKIEADVHYVRWSRVQNFDVRLSTGVLLPNPQHWKDAFTVGVGTEWTWFSPPALPNWDIAVRAGYLHSETPIPNRNFNPAFPDADSDTLSVGVGFNCRQQGRFLGLVPCISRREGFLARKALVIDLVFDVVLWESRMIRGNPAPGVNGLYNTRTYAGGLTAQINF
jgi:long-chain fatty acid transport protein